MCYCVIVATDKLLEEDTMTMGNTILFYRKKHAMTQEALAQALGVTNQAVSKWESNQSCPDVMLLPEIADLFGISLDELFGRKQGKSEEKTEMSAIPWTDDGILRVVVYEGQKLICGGKVIEDFSLEYRNDVKEILSAVPVNCGNVTGDVHAGGNVCCGDVGGDVCAGMNVSCGNVAGDADAGMNVSCGVVYGDVDAGKDVRCGSIYGNVDAGGCVRNG